MFSFFIDNWRFSFVVTFAILLLGLLGLKALQREAFPPVNFARVSVNTIYPGASPEEVQDKVTQIIEEELRGIDGIKDVRSTSQSELSQINIRIDIDRRNPDQVVTEIQRAVQRATSDLPPELPNAPRVSEDKAKEIPVMELALVGPNQDRARDRWADRLVEVMEDVPGIANVRKTGYLEREMQVLLDSRKLQQFAVSPSEVSLALAARIRNVPAGYLDNQQTTKLVRVVGQEALPERIAQLVVRGNDSGRVVRVGDVGRVVDASARARVLARWNGEPATLLVATKAADADALKVVDGIRESVDRFRETLASPYRVEVYNDEGRRIENRLSIVSFNAIFGLLAVLVVLFLFLPGKVGLLSAMSLPICALGTIVCMVYMGANFNIITMIAIIICLGNLVDNSVVISEYFASLREKGVAAREAAIQSAQQFWVPFTASTITIVAAFLPMLVTTGVMGQFIRWIPIVVALALTISLIEALTLLPARLQFLRIQPRAEKSSDGGSRLSRLESAFGGWVSVCLRHRIKTLAGLTALVISGFVVTGVFNRFELFPAEGVEFYVARFELAPEASLVRTDLAGGELSQAVMSQLGSEVVGSIIARAGIQRVNLGDPLAKEGDHVGFLLIAIRPEVAPSLRIPEVLKKLREIPKPSEVRRMTFESIAGGPPVGKPLTVTLRSTNNTELQAATAELVAAVREIPGAFDVSTDENETGQEVRMKIDETRTAAAGVNLNSIGNNLRSLLEGTPVAKLTENGKEFEVRVKFDQGTEATLQDLQATSVLNSRGNLVPLGSLGSFEQGRAPNLRKNYEFRRSITVTADVDPQTLTSRELNDKARKVLPEGKYRDVSVSFGGEEEATAESLQSLMIALVLAMFSIFATLVFTFRSFSRPLLVLSTIPLGLIGVFYSFAIDQRPLSFLAFIGVVGLTGVVINSAIILVDYIEELRRSFPQEKLVEILRRASEQRLRAVLATGITTVVGLLPTAFGLGGYDSLLVPIGLALSWGMIVGTVLSLIWIPVGYLLIDECRARLARIVAR